MPFGISLLKYIITYNLISLFYLSGHGIGSYGFIHESPIQVRNNRKSSILCALIAGLSFQVRVYASEEHPMREGYFFSDEPGYYEPGVGGVRLET